MNIDILQLFLQIFLLAAGFVLLIKGADWFVEGAAKLADRFGIPQLVIGLTIVSIGTSLPELATSVVAAFRRQADIAVTNIVGSNIFNILFILGTTALITPIPYEAAFLIDGAVAVATGIVLWLAVFRKLELRRVWGIIMLCLYAAYFTYLLLI